MNFNEEVDYRAGSDTGENTEDSIQPIASGEFVNQDTDDRPLENVRARTERARQTLRNLLYYADYDRALLIRSDATFTLTQPSSGKYELAATGDLWIYPALTPGTKSGGRNQGGRVFVGTQPYSGVAGTNDLILTTHAQYTSIRGYSDGDDYSAVTAPFPLSVGGNKIRVDLVADGGLGAHAVSFAITETPKVKIVIRHGVSATLQEVITAINADVSSQGSYGVAHYLRASTTAASPGSVSPTDFTGGVVQGQYDSEAHQVTAAQLAAFFAATVSGVQVNRLEEGECLAIGYPIGPVEPFGGVTYPKGGRRQSIQDLPTARTGIPISNITPSSGWSIFSTGREPEKIPGSVPIGKIVNGEFVFIDGTRIAPSESIQLGASRIMYAALASTTLGSSGSSLVGYDGSGFWHADAGSPTALPAGTVNAALDNIVAELASSTTANSGARRIGSEAVSGSASTGNLALSTIAASLRQTFDRLLNQAADATNPKAVVPGGINARVSEFGHAMHGFRPIEKDFGETAPVDIRAGGAVALRVVLNPPTTDEQSGSQKVELATMYLKPWVYAKGAGSLQANETFDRASSTASQVHITTMTDPQFADLVARATPHEDDANDPNVYYLIAKITGVSGSTDTDGYYWAIPSGAGRQVTLQRLDGSTPDFTSAILSTPRITFYHGILVGNDTSGRRIKIFHPTQADGGPLASIIVDDYLDGLIATFYDNGSTTPRGKLWSGRLTFDTPSGVRSSDNILLGSDKALLDGVETGSAVDATTNHHHGANLTGIKAVSPVLIVDDRVDNIQSGGAIARSFGAPDAGRKSLGIVGQLIVTLVPTSGAYTSIEISVWRDSAHTVLLGKYIVDYTATGTGDIRTRTFDVLWIASDFSSNAGRIYMNVTAITNVNNTAAQSWIQVSEKAMIQSYV
jgi:hypothetical protein